jgi:hypothetical protein
MKIIIGWTGKSGRGLAELLQDWLLRVIQVSNPILVNIEEQSSKSIIFDDEETEVSYFGILCLTPENHEDHGLLFEAGVMSNLLPEERISGLLLNLDEDDICRPLQRFPLVDTTKEGMRKLIISINEVKGDKAVAADVLEDTFDIFWNRFESRLEELKVQSVKPRKSAGKPTESLLDIGGESVMIEMLATVRALEKKLHQASFEKSTTVDLKTEEPQPFQKSIISLIHKMSDKDYSEDDIIEFLKNIGIPDSYSRYTVHKTLGTGVHMELHKKTF